MADDKMNFNATWAMAVGGMVGGGIFSVLGVIIQSAGEWAWLSFVIAGLIALVSAHSYNQLSIKYGEGGGAFTFLRKINHQGFAGSLSWILILGYILTLSVYAFTFGHYVAHIFELGSWLPRVLGVAIIALLTFINLKGVSNTSTFEIITVYGKLLVLLGLAVYGLAEWMPEQLTKGVSPKPWHAAIMGAGTIFMAYEGFQLLSYDYNDLKNPDKTLPKATIWSVLTVIFIYVLVTLGTTMIVGADTIIEKKEVALSIAGKMAMGTIGLVIVTIAAAFSTGSAINATLFSTARLMENVAEKKDLPHLFVKENDENIPYYAILIIAALASALAIIGSLSSLVDAASIIFLFTFGTVNFIAFHQQAKYKWICFTGSILCGLAIVADIIEKIEKIPFSLIGLIVISVSLFVFRPYILKKIK
ncbi:APC family permease [Cyclobacterium plantarum]|uniref:Amino acid permease n=1 Tax=Cyclobacterium plantarum TaxID=2716263 RepID=A0ABX0HA13_9BACT|nr:APC family permease [Cyclobacterium plantarum]NHE57213.1 amino acid permease [Cyclobacterium plantarum]